MEEIKNALLTWLNKEENKSIINTKDGYTILHHCFLPRHIVESKGFDTDLIDFLDWFKGESQVKWFDTFDNINHQRILMLQNLERLNGVALFLVGDEPIEGVKEELDIAMAMKIDCYKIPLPVAEAKV